MKSPKFHVGQAVVCINDDWDLPRPMPTPKKNHIYIVIGVHEAEYPTTKWFQFWKPKSILLSFAEFDHRWTQSAFAPVELLPDEALAELIEETLAAPIQI